MSSLIHNKDLWIFFAGIAPAIIIISGILRSIRNYFTKNKIDRLEMYVQLVDDLQEELKRLHDNQREERESSGDRTRELSLIIERQMQEIASLRDLLHDKEA